MIKFQQHIDKDRSLANKILCWLMLLDALAAVTMGVFNVVYNNIGIVGSLTANIYEHGLLVFFNVSVIEASVIAMVMLVRYDVIGERTHARYVARVLIVLLVLSLISTIAINGILAIEFVYIFQFACVIIYQIVNDPYLSYNAPWKNPFKISKNKDRENLPEKYIPLNVFNLFWLFMLAALVGLGIETWFRLFTAGVLEQRSGVLWGPFSPIYGFGAILMTVALNRVWTKNAFFIFLVSMFIGAGFEFFTSWYLEISFGIQAWDYSDALLNLSGRTDISHAIAWGVLGLLWVKFMLPLAMRIIDSIKINWRAAITVVAFVLMLFNGIMTLLALENWTSKSENKLHNQPQLQEFLDANFDDKWMEEHFQTMGIVSQPVHSRENEKVK